MCRVDQGVGGDPNKFKIPSPSFVSCLKQTSVDKVVIWTPKTPKHIEKCTLFCV